MEQLHAELGMAHVQRQAQEEVEQHKLKLLRAQEDRSKWCVYECVFVCERESERERVYGERYWITGDAEV